jgi:ABC-type transport system involved in multi-copper enzyme maturation permease subunit
VNGNIAIALLRDAFAQVVDNLVFRIMMVLLLLMVLPAFLISVQDDRFVVLFFLDLPFEDFMRMLGQHGDPPADAKFDVINGMQSFFTSPFRQNPLAPMARSTILMLCVFATAFFVPRMLEKGAADTIFSKPVSRALLMVSRYLAGLMFVSVIVTCAVGGVHLGLLLRSGYSSPEWLWLIPELIYCFAVFHAVSVFIGVTTRSSVAAILLSAMFFVGNGAAHMMWRVMNSDDEPDTELEEGAEEEERDLGDVTLELVDGLVHVLHLALPKTSDARLIAELVRSEGTQPAVELLDDLSELTVAEPPAGFERDARSSLAKDGVVWIAPHPEHGEARIQLSRASRNETDSRVKQARDLEEQLEANPAVADIDTDREMVAERRADVVTWQETHGASTRLRYVALFQSGEWIFTLDYDGEKDWTDEKENEDALEDFVEGFSFPDFDPMDQPSGYEKSFGWKGDLGHNAFYSLGSTIAFIVLLLALGWFRLSRIDF